MATLNVLLYLVYFFSIIPLVYGILDGVFKGHVDTIPFIKILEDLNHFRWFIKILAYPIVYYVHFVYLLGYCTLNVVKFIIFK